MRTWPHPDASRHLTEPARPPLVYAIGDVHGRLDLLLALEALIVADAGSLIDRSLVVMLGDYVDRGAESAGVLAHLLAPPAKGFRRIALAGNHDLLMLRAAEDEESAHTWLANGGLTTLAAYGHALDGLDAALAAGGDWHRGLSAEIPRTHLDLLARLPFTLTLPGFVFSHAGSRRDIALADHTEHDLLWARHADAALAPLAETDPVIVHGHTPAERPRVTPGRIGIDTGAFMSERLTALRIDDTGKTAFIST
jgi:serine/threonine protein phosphatase 1